MRIQNSALELVGQSHRERSHRVSERLEIRIDPVPTPTEVKVELSNEARAKLCACEAAPVAVDKPEEEDEEELQLSLLELILERLIGRKIDLFRPEDLVQQPIEPIDIREGPAPERGPERPAEPRQGWSLRYDRTETITESEDTTVKAGGSITLEDGRTVDISMEVKLSRRMQLQLEKHIQRGDPMKDPLVLSLDGSAASLQSGTFRFDIDVDGEVDDVPILGDGSAFLAQDADGDGQILDGGELFGGRTGDGFAELAAQDEDGNGWIDEGDSVWSKLRVFKVGADGERSLFALTEVGIGALSVRHVASPYDLYAPGKGLADGPSGRILESGVLLTESGIARPLQRLDLAV